MACEVHVGDLGTVFRLFIVDCNNAPINLTGASALSVVFKTGVTKKTFPGTVFTDGTNYAVDYVTANATDLDIAGQWFAQAIVTLSAGTWSSEIMTFNVVGNL